MAAGEILDLSASLNPAAPPVEPVLARHLDAARRYPDPTGATAALADAIGVEADRVLLTNGGSEAIALVAAERPVGRVDEPDFSLYARHLRLDPAGPRWRSNPHSPSGRLAPPDERAAVWDEAFYPLATGEWTRGDDAVVVGSLTKLFACPGLRIGYVIADPDLIRRLGGRQPQWAVNGLAAAVLPDLLEGADLPSWCLATAELRSDLVELLRRHGFRPDARDGCWVLVPDAGDLRDDLARQRILVRDCGSFGLAGTARIGVPDADGLARLSRALDRR